MALLPSLLNELLDEYSSWKVRPQITLEDYFFHPHARRSIRRPWRVESGGGDDVGAAIVSCKDNEFKVNLDVQQFKPEELKVKVENGFIVVDGKHNERSDQHGFISRQFTRRYRIPEYVQVDGLKSHLSTDGVLSLRAPVMKPKLDKKSIEIPIIRTNAPAVQQSNETQAVEGTK